MKKFKNIQILVITKEGLTIDSFINDLNLQNFKQL